MGKSENENLIVVKGASEHNLKHVDVTIPRDKFIVFTGVSGSGKSCRACDTIFAEGQRRYMESLSSYARQFLGKVEKPKVDLIEGLSPAISIDQKSTNKNPRSTVGTVTEIYDYLRLLYARVGIPHCPHCGKAVHKTTIDEIVDSVMKLDEGTKVQLLALVVRGKKGRHEKVIESAKRSGYIRCRIDGNMYDLSEDIKLDKNVKHDIEIVVDRLVIKKDIEKRLTSSIETVMNLSDGLLQVDVIDGKPLNFSLNFACPDCDISIEEIEPRSFSFNNPLGSCPDCQGLGYHQTFDEELIVPDKSLSINEGAIKVFGWQSCNKPNSYTNAMLKALSKKYKFSLDTPWGKYPKKIKDILLYGTDDYIRVHFNSYFSDS
ncbi:MAG: ABC-ATPase UvrA, partial [Lachnospiraceae bacterium]|nr:ABC-ATPase UvrA [Lachnospiraceae bacterium]